jgi:hypothetical protein
MNGRIASWKAPSRGQALLEANGHVAQTGDGGDISAGITRLHLGEGRFVQLDVAACQSALDRDPPSAFKRDPFDRRALLVALAASELAEVAEAVRARVV